MIHVGVIYKTLFLYLLNRGIWAHIPGCFDFCGGCSGVDILVAKLL